jgi:hypothetical protein
MQPLRLANENRQEERNTKVRKKSAGDFQLDTDETVGIIVVLFSKRFLDTCCSGEK